MSFKPLGDRLKDLPLVLAGPMVRRVEPESVSVWIALREPRIVRLEVNDPKGKWGSDPTETFAIGEFLHMVVVTAKASPSMNDGDTFHYNLFFKPTTGNAAEVDLFSPNVIAAKTSVAQDLLSYKSDQTRMPSFMVPPASIDKLRILHTSCRQIDGKGTDAFPALDHILEEHMKNTQTVLRPAMLFLTGDQIYADGSEPELLAIATDIGDTLLGSEERLPVVEVAPSALPKSRMVVAVKDAGLKNPREFPVLALGEFIALYLLTFSDVLWPEGHEDHDAFKKGLPATRRIFANVATYMIFDDHEVSDSLYLTWSWITPILKSALGRRVLQNAFSAYALCQGWGNTPKEFAPPINPATKEPPGLVLLKELVKWKDTGFIADSDPEKKIQQVLGIPDPEIFEDVDFDLSRAEFHGPETLRWHYTVPCNAVAINVLDTYTWKSFDKATFDPADHLPAIALDNQVSKIGSQSMAVFVVSNVAINRYPRLKDPEKISESVTGAIAKGVGVTVVVALALFYANVFLGSLVFWIIVAILAGAIAFLIPIGDSHGVVGWLRSTDGRIPGWDWVDRAIRTVHFDEVGTEFEWHTAPFERLLDRTARESARQVGGQQLAQVLFISGDVHESFAMRLSYFADFTNASPNLRAVFAQLVSSPAKRRDEGDAQYDEKSSGEFVGWKRSAGDEENEPATSASGKKIKWLGKGEFWVTKITPELPAFKETGEHRYRIEPIHPNPQPVKLSPTTPSAPQTFQSYLSKLALHEQIMLRRLGASAIVSANNVSDVTFPTATTVRQDVWWWYSGIGDDPSAWFARTYDVDLTPPLPPKLPGGP